LVDRRIEEEMGRVMDAFGAERTGFNFLFYYYMNTTHPSLRDSAIVRRMKEFTVQKEKQKYLDIALPE
jgi:hypothetical protein